MQNPSAPSKFIWLPRILAILFLLFLMLFSFDVFDMPGSLLEKIGGFIIHSLPSIILAVILILFWNNPLRSGIAFLVYTVLFNLAFKFILQGWDIFVFLSLPLLLISALFLAAHRMQSRTLPPVQG